HRLKIKALPLTMHIWAPSYSACLRFVWEKIMRPQLALITASILLLGLSGQSVAQSVHFGPGGVEIRPEEPEQRYAPPPPRDELQGRMLGFGRPARMATDAHVSVSE